MKKFKWNRFYTILVLLMFITVTFASFNTNLFINGDAYLRVSKDIRITNIRLLESEYNGYENANSEYTVDSVSMDVSLPRQASSVTYQVTISNVSDKRYKITDILESSYNNKDVKYELVDASIGNIVEPHTEKTFTIKFTNNVTVVEEDDVYETKEYTFDYTGSEQEFIVPYDGEYTLEVWGAQGGSNTFEEYSVDGGYGGYSKGIISLKKNQKLYINVGGAGVTKEKEYCAGGYNGGGNANASTAAYSNASGGGATHISFISGKLSTLSKYKDYILIVAGGGGGAHLHRNGKSYPGSGGGFIGASTVNIFQASNLCAPGTGGSQTSAGSYGTGFSAKGASFGQGGSSSTGYGSGGGGGYYGGGAGTNASQCTYSGNGGSGYIGNTSLSDKIMYCYNCTESEEESTKTISTENHSEVPTSSYAKEGNGYAKLTVTRKIQDNSEFDFDYTGGEQNFTAPYSGVYQLETWGAQGGTIDCDVGLIHGGYGGYSTGLIQLNKNTNLYINVGGEGTPTKIKDTITVSGGYNGGGDATGYKDKYVSSGGGATHIALESGVLSSLESLKGNLINDEYYESERILMVSGGGGGVGIQNGKYYEIGSAGGGFKGVTTAPNEIYGNGGTQTEPGTGFDGGNQTNVGSFGQGANSTYNGNGGGGGFFGGGGARWHAPSGGGSGYIANPKLYEKVMYCYNCEESSANSTKTLTTQSHSEQPKRHQAKEGNGYSRITLLKRTINQTELTLDFTFEEYLNGNEYTFGYTGDYQTFTVPKTGYYQVELWGASGNNHRNDYVSENQVYAGYTAGKIKLTRGEKLYLYVGGKSKSFNSTTATGCGFSGGATDVRLKTGENWYDLASLSSRIMVAGGSGQVYGDPSAVIAGASGGLRSYVVAGTHQVGMATQTYGSSGSEYVVNNQYKYEGEDGTFGIGGSGMNQLTEEGLVTGGGYNAGAGGYYAGGGAPSGGSGSSFISGHNGCVAITAESDTTPRNDSNGSQCSDGTTDITCSYHYSNYVFTDTKMVDGNGYEWTTEVGTDVVGMPTHDGTSTMTGNDGDGFAKITFLEEVPEYHFDYTGNSQTFVAPYNGAYKIELWGASGGGTSESSVGESLGGKGAYTAGTINLSKNEKLYIYVGESGPDVTLDNFSDLNIYSVTFNGGGSGLFDTHEGGTAGEHGFSGGGATDVRLVNDAWNNFDSLKSRIMVAGGGGGAGWSGNGNRDQYYIGGGGYAGGLSAPTAPSKAATLGGTQTSGYKFGIGGNAFFQNNVDNNATGAGGGGYYGGYNGYVFAKSNSSGAGGSSFISGHDGCNSIEKTSTSESIVHTDTSLHYSGKSFSDTLMIDGGGYQWTTEVVTEVVGMPSHDGRSTMIGNTGNGYAKITLIEKIDTYNINYDLDGGSLKNAKKTYSQFDTGIELSTPTKEGYTFLGWTGGKNLFDKTTAEYDTELVRANGTSRALSGWFVSDYIEVKPSTDYYVSASGSKSGQANAFYDADKKFIKNVDVVIGKITSPSNAKYLRINGVTSVVDSVMVEESSSNSSFEAYISVPTKSVTIASHSTGIRYYKANWGKNVVAILNPNGGTVDSSSISVVQKMKYGDLPVPSKTGYDFKGWKVIPDELESTDYIETNAEGYINTEYVVNSSTSYEIVIQALNEKKADGCLLGSRRTSISASSFVLWNNTYYGVTKESISPVYAGSQLGGDDPIVDSAFPIRKFSFKDKTFYVDDEVMYSFDSTFNDENNIPLYLFTLNQNNSADSRKYRGKMYYFLLWDSTGLVRYYVPTIRKEDSVKGVLDLVNGRFTTLGNVHTDYPVISVDSNSVVSTDKNHTLIATWEKK
ncbi:MAG: InlB B-repeat-containing protein [Bacilli bacterium]|nr:InlB B-repeat-containing protein [Bacilli bacterium]